MTDAAPKREGLSRSALLERLQGVFLTHGYDGASLARLASASGLGKASLYHHFPGGKQEIAGALIRAAFSELQTRVFAPVLEAQGKALKKAAAQRQLLRLIDRFGDYVAHGERHCLLMLFAQQSAPGINPAALRDQFEGWSGALTECFAATGRKPKAARRAAADLLNQLYGALLLSRAMQDPRILRQAMKRMKSGIAD